MAFHTKAAFSYATLLDGQLEWHRAMSEVNRVQASDDVEKIQYTSSCSGDYVSLLKTTTVDGTVQLQWTVDSQAAVEWVMCEYPVGVNERFYGFGETYGELEQRGKELKLWVENGCVRDLSYKPIPFYISSAGYGIYMEHNELIYARMATPDIGSHVQLKVNSSELKLYRFEHAKIETIIDAYTTVVGKPTLPPPWFFGAWKSRDWRTENQETVMLDLRKQRELGIPCSVKLIDAAWEQELNDFQFHKDKFPNFQSVINEAKTLAYQIVIWISPWVANWTEVYKELDAKGYFLKTPSGETYIHRLGNSPNLLGSMFDFTHPGAVSWWQERVQQLMDLGIRGIKTDFGEQVPEDAVFYDGSTGKTMHNYYPVLYNKVTHDVIHPYNGILLGRSSWAGSQAFTGIWAGDQTADFAPRSGMLSTIFAGQNIGLCGFPYWGSDIGGYFGTPDRECFIRWTQYAAFTPCMELHGLGERDPWDMDQQALDNYVAYTSLHTRLFPYLYQLAIEGADKGLPMIRAMMLHYNEDPMIHELACVSFQYLFGRDLLVAPIFYEGISREVYLPAGDWVQFWTGERIQGPWNGRIDAPLDQTPVYIRAGAVIPVLPKGIQTIGQYDVPEQWMNVLGSERWEFLVAPGDGSFVQGGVRITQQTLGKGSIKIEVCFDRDQLLTPVPKEVVLKIRLSKEQRERCTLIGITENESMVVNESGLAAWESGLWVALLGDQSNYSFTLNIHA